MSYEHLGELLSAYLDGELTPEEQERVVLHIDGCEACRNELLDLHAARSAVRSLPVLDMPAALLSPLADADVPSLDAAKARRLRARPVAWIAAAAAALLLVIGGIGMMRHGSTGVGFDLDTMMDQHQVRVSVDSGLPAVQIVQVAQR